MPEINQCDGCRRGLPVRRALGIFELVHHNPNGEYDGIVCTAARYGHKPVVTNEPATRYQYEQHACDSYSRLMERHEMLQKRMNAVCGEVLAALEFLNAPDADASAMHSDATRIAVRAALTSALAKAEGR